MAVAIRSIALVGRVADPGGIDEIYISAYETTIIYVYIMHDFDNIKITGILCKFDSCVMVKSHKVAGLFKNISANHRTM